MATPAEFLTQAKELLKSASKDVEYRNVITQAYYAAFHAAREFEEALPHRSQVTTREGSHDSLFQRLEVPNSKLDYGLKIISQDVAAQMRQLKPLRELASCELKETIRIDQVEAAIRGRKK